MFKEWDADEEAKDAKTYQTREDGLKTLNHIIKKIYRNKGRQKKLNHQNKNCQRSFRFILLYLII